MNQKTLKLAKQLLCSLRGHGRIVRWRCHACGYQLFSTADIRRLEAIERAAAEQYRIVAEFFAQQSRQQNTAPRPVVRLIDWRAVLGFKPADRPGAAAIATKFRDKVKTLRPDLPAKTPAESVRKAQALSNLIAARDAAMKECKP